jgi:flagellar hook protein FlgE
MGLQSTLYAAVSGINASGRMLTEIGNNIANSGTIAFKSRTVLFGDVMNAALLKQLSQGQGVQVTEVRTNFAQGSLQRTGNALDVAIDGEGFFQVKDDKTGRIFYTRAGQFAKDKDGRLVDANGLLLQGYQAQNGAITGTIGNLSLETSPIAKATSAITVQVNLDSNASTTAFSLTDPLSTSNFSTSLTVYDSIGNAHLLTIYFSKQATNTWKYHVVANAAEVNSTQEVGSNGLVADGTLTFNTNGVLTSASGPHYYNASETGIDFVGATPDQRISLVFTGSSQLAAPSSVQQLAQDGSPAGVLSSVSVDTEGRVVGKFTNGLTQYLGQIALARFANPDKLVAEGRNLFSGSAEAGLAQIGTGGSGLLGRVVAGSLEFSNVDLAQEFVNMIGAQRMFQANARIVSVTDEVMQEVVNLKR